MKPLLKSIKTIIITLPSKPSLLIFSEMAYVDCGLIGFIKLILVIYHSPSSSLSVYVLIPLLLIFDRIRRKRNLLQFTGHKKKKK